MEFACAVAGAKVILVMGHTACGAIKGAIDNVQLGNLTGLLESIKPAIEMTQYGGERTSKNAGFVDAVAQSNVRHTIDVIRGNSSILADLEKKGQVRDRRGDVRPAQREGEFHELTGSRATPVAGHSSDSTSGTETPGTSESYDLATRKG
jgi:hypothetical protein